MNHLNNNNLTEFKGQIINIFENFCDNRNIKIVNKERDEYNKNAGWTYDENPVKIFGQDYDLIGNEIEFFMVAEFHTVDGYTLDKNDFHRLCKVLLNRFDSIITDRGTDKDGKTPYLFIKDTALLAHSIENTCRKWNLLSF